MSMQEKASTEKVYCLPLHDLRQGVAHKIRHPPTVHIAQGFDERLPILKESKRALICISDWQYETSTQEHFWEQARSILSDHLGGDDIFSRAIVLVAGDMASSDNTLRGSASDAVPNLHWLHNSFPNGDVFFIYGNHCLMSKDHFLLTNNASSGVACILPHGQSVTVRLDRRGQDKSQSDFDEADLDNLLLRTAAAQGKETIGSRSVCASLTATKSEIPPGLSKKERAAIYAQMKFEKRPKPQKLATRNNQWRRQNPEQALLAEAMMAHHMRTSLDAANTDDNTKNVAINSIAIGALHGIPTSHSEGFRKIERSKYFDDLDRACKSSDILVMHSNPCLPGQEHQIKGDDALKILECFQKSSAYLLVHGHMHTEPVVSVLESQL